MCWSAGAGALDGKKIALRGGGGGTEAHFPNPPPPLLGRRARQHPFLHKTKTTTALRPKSGHQRSHGLGQGNLKIAVRGGGGVTWTPAKGGGGVGEMGFRVGPFVLCKNGCWRQRRRNTNFGPKKFFPPIIFPPTFE